VDRVFRGAVSGIIAGLFMNAWSFISYILNFTKLRFIDWAAILIYGYPPAGLAQDLFALFLHLVWASFLGIGFAILLPQINSRGYVLKGIGYSWITGFMMYATTTMLRVPYLDEIPFSNVITNFIGATIWGLVTAIILKRLEKTNIQ